MFKASISTIADPKKVLYSIEKEDKESAIAWLKYNVPGLEMSSLKLGSPLEYGETYLLLLEGEESKEEPAIDESEESKEEQPVEIPDLEKMTAEDAIDLIESTTDQELLQLLLEMEQEGKKRKTVIAAIKEKVEH